MSLRRRCTKAVIAINYFGKVTNGLAWRSVSHAVAICQVLNTCFGNLLAQLSSPRIGNCFLLLRITLHE